MGEGNYCSVWENGTMLEVEQETKAADVSTEGFR